MSQLIRLQIIAIAAALCVVLMMSQMTEANPVNQITSATGAAVAPESATEAAKIETTTQNKTTLYCETDRQPCGWAVYGKGSPSKIQYFIQNTCTCDKTTQKCLLDGEDLSLSAYVYRCKNKSNLPTA